MCIALLPLDDFGNLARKLALAVVDQILRQPYQLNRVLQLVEVRTPRSLLLFERGLQLLNGGTRLCKLGSQFAHMIEQFQDLAMRTVTTAAFVDEQEAMDWLYRR